MRKRIFRIFLMSAAMSFCLLFGASFVRAQQCGLPGLPPCPSKTPPKKTTPKKVITKSNKNTQNSSKSKTPQTTRNKSTKQEDTSSLNLNINQRFGFIVEYKNSPKFREIAFQIRGILIKNGFRQQQLGYTSDPSILHDYDREDNNSYLSFDSSVPQNIREQVTKLIRSILPDVHVEIVDKSADDYFLLWII